jgi:ribonuclease P protein component
MKVERLKGRGPFSETFNRGRTYSNRYLVVFVQETPGEPARAGFATARAAGRPVKRNRIRRRLRAAFAEVSDRMRPGRRVVILGRQSVLEADWPELCRAMESVLDRAGVLEAR